MDDLMFSIKIQTAAKSIGGIDLFFERTPDMVLSRIREKQPSLVIFDLNSKRMDTVTSIHRKRSHYSSPRVAMAACWNRTNICGSNVPCA